MLPDLKDKMLRNFGQKIRRWRVGSGLSQFEAAVSLGCSLSAVCKWEQGLAMPNAHFMAAIFALSDGELDLSASDLIDDLEDEDE